VNRQKWTVLMVLIHTSRRGQRARHDQTEDVSAENEHTCKRPKAMHGTGSTPGTHGDREPLGVSF
jgi:hypothetical protein